jgi:hypothetical protein
VGCLGLTDLAVVGFYVYPIVGCRVCCGATSKLGLLNYGSQRVLQHNMGLALPWLQAVRMPRQLEGVWLLSGER